MNIENTQENETTEHLHGTASSAPPGLEGKLQVRRPRPGSILIVAPPGTLMTWSTSRDGLELELRQQVSE